MGYPETCAASTSTISVRQRRARSEDTMAERPADTAEDLDDLLKRGAAALGVALDDQQLAAFRTYRELLLEWNARINLTAITDPREIVVRHFLDSLSVTLGVPATLRGEVARVLDVGSGAGFPGLVLAIAFPRWRVTVLEATSKKVRFLREVAGALHLSGAYPLEGRAEDLAHKREERGHYDVVTARALAPLPTLLEYCEPFVKEGGVVIAPKKGDLTAELAAGGRAAAQLGGRMEAPVPVAIPDVLEDGRVLVVVTQERPSLPLYPRQAGAPAKHPLGQGR
jgi:16S rRNA (guanine527-N7)-methyltransferase